MKMLNKIKTLLLIQLLLLLASHALKAQVDVLNKASVFFEKEQYDSSRVYVDQAILHPETKEMPAAWYLRGATYSYIYSQREKKNKKSPARIATLESFRKLIILDKDKEYLDNDVLASMESLIISMRNDAADCMDPLEYETAIELFRKSQEYYKIINPSQEAYKAREIEFGLALGSLYYSIVETTKDSISFEKYSNLAKEIFMKVLELDRKNVSANYSLGILFYNQAVNLIKTSEYVDLSEIDNLQEKSNHLFKTSLPYMEIAEDLDPERIATLEGLSGIWFSLNDNVKYKNYQKKLEEIKNKKK